ncbi:hypothetical protein E2C01_060964 [Portunus trituberculatus]|uniref:Uncharacterized protein n=1 Tax=Portunus trituberculatus TaxID=210409 RepID=A0A5B7H2L6_PORTR|nr:hypothetical protein [Portunus trituberculatus]
MASFYRSCEAITRCPISHIVDSPPSSTSRHNRHHLRCRCRHAPTVPPPTVQVASPHLPSLVITYCTAFSEPHNNLKLAERRALPLRSSHRLRTGSSILLTCRHGGTSTRYHLPLP